MTIVQLLPLLLISAVAIIAPLLAGLPSDQLWTSICLALGFIAFAIQIALPDSATKANSSDKWQKILWTGLVFFSTATVLSFLWHWISAGSGKPAYFDIMLRSVFYWLGMIAIFKVAGDMAQSKLSGYALVLSAVFAATAAGAVGLQDYLISTIKLHLHDWREFGTSTPDYFAAYLILTIPVTLALFLGTPSGKGQRFGLLYGFSLLLQLAVLPTTGSRFALISLVFSLILFAVLLFWIRRNGFEVSPALRNRTLAMFGGLIVVGVVFGRSLIHRLQAGTMKAQAHSGDFRIYTWKGTLKLIEAHPILGSGPGMYVYAYPKYALVSFTRVAHNGYLQLLSEIGIVGVLGLALAFVAVIALGIMALRQTQLAETEHDKALDLLAVSDERILVIGLIAGISGGLLQNLIDSDWNFTNFAVTLFISAGMLYGLSLGTVRERTPYTIPKIIALVPGAASIICLCWTASAVSAGSGNFAQAVSLDPYNPQYRSDYAWKTLIGSGDYQGAESQLTQAIALGSDPVTYYRRGVLYDQTQRPQLALADFTAGLQLDPNSLELLKRAADVETRLGDQNSANIYYRHMADMEMSPFGQVRAITEVVEYRYAYADAALGIDAARRNDPSAVGYLKRAQTTLEAYCDEGGSANAMRAAEVGTGGPHVDSELQSLYNDVMGELTMLYQSQGHTDLAKQTHLRQLDYSPQFIHAAE